MLPKKKQFICIILTFEHYVYFVQSVGVFRYIRIAVAFLVIS
jgi:hypothetical protein